MAEHVNRACAQDCIRSRWRVDHSSVTRIYSAEFLPNPIPEAHLQIGHRPAPASPDLKGCDQNKLLRGSWGLARELRSDHFGDWDDCKLTYHRWRFELPLFVIRDIIAEAQQNGIAAPKIKLLFNSACFETNAAVFDGLAQNPGGLFRTVFRRRCQKGTGRFQSVVRQPESQIITRERTQICRPIKSVGSVKTATDAAHDDSYRIDMASKLSNRPANVQFLTNGRVTPIANQRLTQAPPPPAD
jgi:hypothetical protein